MKPGDGSSSGIDGQVAGAVDQVMRGRISRAQFVKRAAALGLALPVVSAVLAACGDDDSGGSGTATAAGSGLSAVQSIVYPLGVASISDFNGPYGTTTAAELPAAA